MDVTDHVEITARIARRTDRAVLLDDGTQEIWLPLSQVEIRPLPGAASGSDFVSVTMPEWLAAEKRLL